LGIDVAQNPVFEFRKIKELDEAKDMIGLGISASELKLLERIEKVFGASSGCRLA